MNWRITPSPPETIIDPLSCSRSPAIMRKSVVLPEPFAPISATFAPSPTRKETSLSSTRPSERAYSTPETFIWPKFNLC